MKKILLIILSICIYGFVYFFQLTLFVLLNLQITGASVGVITALGGIIPFWTSYKFVKLLWKNFFFPKPVAYSINNIPATYNYDEVVYDKGLVYLKKDMSLITGKISSRIYEGEVVNGKKEGLHRSWFANGQIYKEGSYVNGKEEGLHRSWLVDGQLREEGSYLNGKLIR